VLDASPGRTESRVAQALAKAEDTLTIGGQLWLRMDANLPENPSLSDVRTASPNFLEVFTDARPNDRVRAFAQGRVYYDWTVRSGDTSIYGQPLQPSRVLLDQLWVKFDVDRRAFFTLGKQRIKWGSGRFWNPTDFLNPTRLDPVAVFDERTGVSLVKLQVPIDTVNLYAIADLDGASRFDQIGGALRAEIAFAQSEIALSASARKGSPLRLGADLSSGIGPFDVHGEVAVRHGDTAPFFEADPGNVLPTQVDRSGDWIPQVVAGIEWSAKYSGRDSLTLGLEYFFNDAGTGDASLYPFMLQAGTFVPFYVGRHYLAANLYLPAPGPLEHTNVSAAFVANLSDHSYIARLDWFATVLTWLDLNAYVMGHFGQNGELHYSVTIPPLPDVPGLDNGLDVPPPLLDVGGGARVRF